MDTKTIFDRYNLETHEVSGLTRVAISDTYGGCVSMYSPDDLDERALEYAQEIVKNNPNKLLHAADLGSSPYCPQSIRFALAGLQVDAFDLEPPAKQFAEINQELGNRINYIQKNLRDVTAQEIKSYSLVYTNRCLFFLSFQDAKDILRKFIDKALPGTHFFISVMDMNGPLAINYPDQDKPLSERFSLVKNDFAAQIGCNMPVCFYYADEVESELLHDFPVRILELIQTTPRSIKVVFKVI